MRQSMTRKHNPSFCEFIFNWALGAFRDYSSVPKKLWMLFAKVFTEIFFLLDRTYFLFVPLIDTCRFYLQPQVSKANKGCLQLPAEGMLPENHFADG